MHRLIKNASRVSSHSYHPCIRDRGIVDRHRLAASHDIQVVAHSEAASLVSVPAPHPVAKRSSANIAYAGSVSPFRGGVCFGHQAMAHGTGCRRSPTQLRAVFLRCVCHSQFTMTTQPNNKRCGEVAAESGNQLLEGIAKGEQAISEGRVVSHEMAKVRMSRWLM